METNAVRMRPNLFNQQQPLQLRHYQTAAVDAIWQALAEEDGNPLAVLPTGTGKALVICEFVRRAVQAYPQVRILVMTHSQELVAQNYEEMIGLWPECPAGIHNAGLGSYDIKSQVIFGSIQSMHRKALKFQQVDIVLVDEAQSIPRKADTTWLRFFSEVAQINPFLRVVGLTATDYRLDSGRLTEGKDAMFSRVVFDYSILDAINEGFLCPPISRTMRTQIDTSGVGTRGGEFIAAELDAVASDPATVAAIVDELIENGANRRGWIVFGAGVKHCTMIRDAIRERGYSCEGVFAVTPKPERKAHIENFKAQRIRCLVSVSALAVGFNAKHVDLVGLARPTKSTGLYIQSCGRGTRLFPGKEDCLILDWGGNIRRHGFIDQPNVKAKQEGRGDMPVKTCPVCGADNFIAARECSECGAPFDIEGSKLSVVATSAPLLSTQIKPPEWVGVKDVRYYRNVKTGKPDTLRVTYQSGMLFHSEWVCFDHQGYPRSKAEAWWLKRAAAPVPGSVDEALQRTGELRIPTQIQIRPSGKDGKFIEICNARFD